ncbi:hypothetical protein [Enterovirga sp.]|jgi:hypothetical protein|uniref:hypothetical protein n=1 Tax=Enterovirga sp. TaxID=2026350 RepID=UPI002604E9FC|nr:hypothetical protein [Enterovirga sp.]MDB5592606.1 hypothetical protein [Enterovirga sp.]
MAGDETGSDAGCVAGPQRDGAAHAARGRQDSACAQALSGVALRLDGSGFRIVVIGDAGETVVELGPYGEEEVIAVWRSLAATSGLPLLVERALGGYEAAYPQMGRLVIGAPLERRCRLAVLSGRRPRFLARRKPARLPRRPVVFREKEMVSGRGR